MKKLLKVLFILLSIVVIGVTAWLLWNYFTYPENKYKRIAETKTVYIPISSKAMLGVEVPKYAELKTTDGIAIWDYVCPDGTTYNIYKLSEFDVTDTKNYKGSYITPYTVYKQYGGYIISYTNDQQYLWNVVDDFTKDAIVPSFNLLSKNRLTTMPETTDATAKLSNIDVYMPPYFKENKVLAITTDIAKADNGNFFSAFAAYGTQEELIENSLAWLAAMDPKYNPDKVTWYEDSKTFYACSNNYLVGLRSLTYNKWATFYSTIDTKDFLFMNLTAKHANE